MSVVVKCPVDVCDSSSGSCAVIQYFLAGSPGRVGAGLDGVGLDGAVWCDLELIWCHSCGYRLTR